MRIRDYGLYAVAPAILVVGALRVGVPIGSLALLGPVLICSLMMIFLMHGMRAGANRRHEGVDDAAAARSRSYDGTQHALTSGASAQAEVHRAEGQLP